MPHGNTHNFDCRPSRAECVCSARPSLSLRLPHARTHASGETPPRAGGVSCSQRQRMAATWLPRHRAAPLGCSWSWVQLVLRFCGRCGRTPIDALLAPTPDCRWREMRSPLGDGCESGGASKKVSEGHEKRRGGRRGGGGGGDFGRWRTCGDSAASSLTRSPMLKIRFDLALPMDESIFSSSTTCHVSPRGVW